MFYSEGFNVLHWPNKGKLLSNTLKRSLAPSDKNDGGYSPLAPTIPVSMEVD